MELLSPAGNSQKLYYAYAYGADAAYIGLKQFSLRAKADNFYEEDISRVRALKEQFPNKKLHCALNIVFHNKDIDNLLQSVDYFKQYPIDAFIVQDLGIVPILQKHFPNAALHLSTQASCVNREAVKMYKSMGFSRVVLGREAGLAEIRQIKDTVPDMELEVFVHGAMCIAYAGRCLMSAYLTNRSAQAGLCSHACRWNFSLNTKDGLTEAQAKRIAQSGGLVLEEASRPGEYLPVFEGDDFTAILSSKDLRMIEHLADLKAAGVDSLKIEGRMKSLYYVALVTRAYRKALDALEGKITDKEAAPFVAELENVSHRESTTGFYYNAADANETTSGASDSPYDLAATIGGRLGKDELAALLQKGDDAIKLRQTQLDSMHPSAKAARLSDYQKHPEKAPPAVQMREGWSAYLYQPMNMVKAGDQIEFISPDVTALVSEKESWLFIDPETGLEQFWACDGHDCVIYTKYDLQDGTIVRTKDPEYTPGVIRDTGRTKRKAE
ncbi:MAG: U32 family peptidase [Treponema sp.]|nr:U32 family peptidase [Treponema sp.]